MKFDNYMILDFPSKSANEAFARSAVACFAAQMDPTLEELGDIRTAVSEAYTTGGAERSGMGFTIMESFMTDLEITSKPGKGTTVHMRRKLQRRQ